MLLLPLIPFEGNHVSHCMICEKQSKILLNMYVVVMRNPNICGNICARGKYVQQRKTCWAVIHHCTNKNAPWAHYLHTSGSSVCHDVSMWRRVWQRLLPIHASSHDNITPAVSILPCAKMASKTCWNILRIFIQAVSVPSPVGFTL